jgi:SAM-dependent methyltransferase
MLAAWNPAQPEISDLIIQHDPVTLKRVPVRKQDVLAVFEATRNTQAIRVIRALPERDGFLDAPAIDRLFLTVHWEMQRLAEEFYHGDRVHELLRAILSAVRKAGHTRGLRLVDVGCGIGYTIRYLAAHMSLAAEGVELVGVDLNSVLVREAARLARAENLPCRFVHGDAFSLTQSGNIYMSTGVLHHFRGADLGAFLSRHDRSEALAFFHYDFRPSVLAGPGSWLFHMIRMRTALAKHDGVLSALRVHSARDLVSAARAAAPGFATGMYGERIWRTPLPRVFHTIVGIRPPLVENLKRSLGRRVTRLSEIQ